jgi:large subunit ribosomal protein L21
MYAVIQFGSDQFKVSEGDIIEVDRLEAEDGKTITVDDILMVSDGKEVKIGQPALSGSTVQAQVLKETLGDKVVAFKYWKRKAHAFKKGHRPKLTALKITKIQMEK